MRINGIDGAELSALDRGLAFGDGVFETMRRCATGIPLLERHLARLLAGCERLRIAVDAAALREEIERMLADAPSPAGGAVLKLIVTRGPGNSGYRAEANGGCTRILIESALPARPSSWWSQGVGLRYCDTRLGTNATLAGIKHLNRLEQVLARQEWDDDSAQEGLLSDVRGRIVEGISTNLFMVSGGRLVTPVIEHCGVAGVMRAHILETVARALGIGAATAHCERATIAGAQEVFVCNAVIGVWPVVRLATRNWPVGPVTRRVQEHVERLFPA